MTFDEKSIQGALQTVKRPELARILSEVWKISLSEYSSSLWERTSEPPSLELEISDISIQRGSSSPLPM